MATQKITLTIELTMAELQRALLPNGGKIVELKTSTPAKRRVARKTPTNAPKKKTGQKK